jgi:hypothetical protein
MFLEQSFIFLNQRGGFPGFSKLKLKYISDSIIAGSFELVRGIDELIGPPGVTFNTFLLEIVQVIRGTHSSDAVF